MRVATFLAAVALACAIAVPAAAGDLTIVSKTSTAGPMASSGTSTTYMTPGKLRMQQDRTDTVVDIATGTITNIEHNKKQYWQMSSADIEAMGKGMADAMAEMQKNPQAAAMMQKMMGGVEEAKLDKGTGTRTIAGYPCTQYTISMGGTVRMVYWTTTALQPPFNVEQLYAAQSALLRANPMLGRMSSLFDQMKNVKGVPLASTTTMTIGPMHVENSSEATSVTTSAIPASTFDLPAAYKKVDRPLPQMQKR